MKKLRLFCAGVAVVVGAQSSIAQAVRDRNMIPVAVNLNEVLRMTILNGGNIEFTFNTIADYKSGMGNKAAAATDVAGTVVGTTASTTSMYQTDFSVASSSRWTLVYGAEQATFIGTDNAANTMGLDNVGFCLTIGTSAGTVGTNWDSPLCPTFSTEVAALEAFGATGVTMIQDATVDVGVGNGGDISDNSFHLFWQCGTASGALGSSTAMNATAILNQSPSLERDRYITNVLFELASD